LITDKQLRDHEDYLREKIFFTETRWPQYNLLLGNLLALADATPWGATVLSYERNILFGGRSMFAPFFRNQHFAAIDRTPPKNKARGEYNNIPDDRKLEVRNTIKGETNPDLIIVPNLLHHVRDPEAFFSELYNILKPGGCLYIFEPLFRELHQEPEHYCQFTPYGLKERLEAYDMEIMQAHETGGPFTAMFYFLDQAKQYIPEGDPLLEELGLLNDSCKGFMEFDATYQKNLKRPTSSCPTAFSILARKPE